MLYKSWLSIYKCLTCVGCIKFHQTKGFSPKINSKYCISALVKPFVTLWRNEAKLWQIKRKPSKVSLSFVWRSPLCFRIVNLLHISVIKSNKYNSLTVASFGAKSTLKKKTFTKRHSRLYIPPSILQIYSHHLKTNNMLHLPSFLYKVTHFFLTDKSKVQRLRDSKHHGTERPWGTVSGTRAAQYITKQNHITSSRHWGGISI